MIEQDSELDAALSLLRGTAPPLRQSPQAIWRRVQASAAGPSSARQAVAFVAAAAVGVLLVVTVMPRRGAPPAPQTRIEAVAGARWSREGRDVRLEAGRLRIDAPGPLVARTPFGDVASQGGRFQLEVAAQHLEVIAETGALEVSTQLKGARVVNAGGALVVRRQVAPAAREVPATLLEPAAVTPRSACGGESACLERTAKGNTLAAQLALFDLALEAQRGGERDRAVAAWRQYLARFPDGVLAPEVSGAVVRALVNVEPEAALAEAERYHERFGSEPSAGGVELLRAHLLRDFAGRFDEGCALYEALCAQAAGGVRAEALFQSAMCRQARGDQAGAAARLQELERVAPSSERVRP